MIDFILFIDKSNIFLDINNTEIQISYFRLNSYFTKLWVSTTIQGNLAKTLQKNI